MMRPGSLPKLLARSVFLSLVLTVCVSPLRAQEPKADARKPTAPAAAATPTAPASASVSGTTRRPDDPARRVPDFFGQIGLSLEQRERIYKVREGHFQKIHALEKQLADARAAMLAECEDVLSPIQKELLSARRKAAQDRRASSRTATPTPTATPRDRIQAGPSR
jgi:hypothetical protein